MLPRSLAHAGQSEAIFRGLLKMWLAIEIEDHPGWFEWQKRAFELIQTNLMELGTRTQQHVAQWP